MANPQRPVLHYREAGTGTPLVLLPAFPLSSQMWESQIADLSETFRVIAVDPRGFGKSPSLGDAPPSLDVVADDVRALLDHAGIDKAVIGGLSLGGYEALAFLSKYPERVAGAILADTRASADSETGRENRERDALSIEAAIGGPSEKLEELKFKVAYGRMLNPDETINPALKAQLREWVRQTLPESVVWALRAMKNRPDTHDVLARTTVPVVVIAGDRDEIIPPEETLRMLQAIPGKHRHMRWLAEANHLSSLEKPDAFVAAVKSFPIPLARSTNRRASTRTIGSSIPGEPEARSYRPWRRYSLPGHQTRARQRNMQ